VNENGESTKEAKEAEALAGAGVHLGKAAEAFKDLGELSSPVLLLKEEIKDVLSRVNGQRDQLGA
jgi:hypothetical protein